MSEGSASFVGLQKSGSAMQKAAQFSQAERSLKPRPLVPHPPTVF